MKKEQILDLMNAMPADLIEEADAAQPVKRRRGLVRTGLVAACLCLALVGTTFAAVRYFWVEVFSGEEQTGFRVHGELVKYPMDQFSAQLQADCASWDSENVILLKFDTWEEAKTYMGDDIPCVWPENVLMDQIDLYHPPINLYLMQDRDNENKLNGVQTHSYGEYFDSETGRLIAPTIDMYVATEHYPTGEMDPYFEGSIGGGLYGNSGSELEQMEDYLMPNGATAGIVMVKYPWEDCPSYECIANFIEDGIRYQVFIHDIGCKVGPEALLSDLKTILDLFP